MTNAFRHRCTHSKFILYESLNTIECGICGEKLNPIWVLSQYCNRESRFNMEIERLKKVADKADKKNRCKCEKCGEMTIIQR